MQLVTRFMRLFYSSYREDLVWEFEITQRKRVTHFHTLFEYIIFLLLKSCNNLFVLFIYNRFSAFLNRLMIDNEYIA